MNDFSLTGEQISKARAAASNRFEQNTVAKQLVPEHAVSATTDTISSNRFDFDRGIVIDRETIDLYEPYAVVKLTRTQGDEADLNRALTTLNRKASELARWHDVLVFYGYDTKKMPQDVHMTVPQNMPKSLREAAMEVEKEKKGNPNPIPVNSNQDLVGAAEAAILELEGRGYYSDFHVILGAMLSRELHTPTRGSLVLPRDRIEPRLRGGGFYETTTLPEDEALMISFDGPTVDCIFAGEPEEQVSFEWLRSEEDTNTDETLYHFKIREKFAPRVRENRAVVRLQFQPPPAATAARPAGATSKSVKKAVVKK